MPQTDIGSSEASDLTNAMTDYSVGTASTDGAFEQKETTWTNTNFSQYLGYYKSIPELKSTIDTKAIWIVGKGFKADKRTANILNKIRGFGKDTFNTILQNDVRTYYVGGDSYNEIVTTDGELINKNGSNLSNLKPLDPAVMVHVVNSQGMLIRFEQNSKVKGQPPKRFKPEEIFYLPKNRFADEIHGTGIITAIENIILMRNEAMNDWKRVLHRNVDPMMIFHLDTDDTTVIAAFKAKVDAGRGKGENMYVPKDAVVPEQLSIAPNAALNPLPWISDLTNYFYPATNTPDIIVGSSKQTTEATAKILYLVFQQPVEDDQLFIEENVKAQLHLVINLEFPASIEPGLASDEKKDGKSNFQKNDTTAGSGE